MSACPGATPLALTTCGGTSFDSVLEVRAERCTGPVAPAACDDDDPTCGNSTASRVETLLQGSGAGDSLWFIVVDGWASNDDGPYALEVSY
ncbi:MAG: hypothetical protein HYZ27_01985 [Deltaproteobacteria bacterium]|nr:hypothetical protein [Deltaproteobacteria bacterium]